MADMVTKQELEAAKIDVKHAGEAVNEKKIVTPRYGESFKSLPLAIQEVIETGGFEPFATEAELKASIPVLEKKAAYSLDTHKVFLWESEIWKDTGLSAIDQAKTYTDEKDQESKDLINSIAKEVMSLLFKSQSSESLFDFTDTEGSIVLQILRDGKLKVIDLENDLVTHLNNTFNFNKEDYLFLLLDSDQNIVAYIDKDGKFFIVGLDTDIATAINNKSESSSTQQIIDTSNLNNYSYRDTFTPKAQNLLNFFRNTQNAGQLAPVPLQQFEQNFTISNAWINQANITEWGNYVPVKTPYGNDRGVVHPQVLEFPNGFMSYRYIVAITGYTNGVTAEENPFLLGSQDLQNFDLITDILNEPESYTWEKGVVYNSDPFMFYDIKTGELVLTFRRYMSAATSAEAVVILYAITTKDGKTWSEPFEFYSTNKGDLQIVSQAIHYDVKTETYHMYGINQAKIRHFTTKDWRTDWVQQADIATPVDDTPWHVDIRAVGDKILFTYQNRVGNTSVGFKLGISSDFNNVMWADAWWNPTVSEVYKATMLPQFNEQNEMRLVYMWTTNQTAEPASARYKLFVQATPFLNVDYLEK